MSQYYAAYNIRGVIYEAQKRYDFAARDFQKAISIFPCSELFLNQCKFYREGDVLRKTMCGDAATNYFNLGSVQLFQEDYAGAVVNLSQSISREPEYAKAYETVS